jgi:hypothetical protein
VTRYQSEAHHARLRKFGRVSFHILTVACVIWGTFSAAAVFAIRYDLWPVAEPAKPETVGASEAAELQEAPTLNAANWRRVLSPPAVLAVALNAPELSEFRGDDSTSAAIEASAALIWQGRESRALWRLLLQRPGCPCPLDRVTRWDIARVLVDPLSGTILQATLQSGLSPAELSAERSGYIAHPVAPVGES